jgi:CHAT domain-containing protein
MPSTPSVVVRTIVRGSLALSTASTATVLPGHPMASVVVAQQRDVQSADQQAEFARLDAIREKTAPKTGERAVAAANAAAHAGRTAWTHYDRREWREAAQWLTRQVELRRESDLIWLEILDADGEALVEATLTATTNVGDAGWTEVVRRARTAAGHAELAAEMPADFTSEPRAGQVNAVQGYEAMNSALDSVRNAQLKLARRQHDRARELAAAKDAVTWGREWLATANKVLPAARPAAVRQLASGLVVLGNAYRSSGDLTAARAHCEEALNLLRRSFPAKTERGQLATTLYQLGLVEQDAGFYERAAELFLEALSETGAQSRSDTARPTVGEIAEGAAAAYPWRLHQSLGAVREVQGSYAEALQLYRTGEEHARRQAAALAAEAKRSPQVTALGAEAVDAALMARAPALLLQAQLGDGFAPRQELRALVRDLAPRNSDAAAALLIKLASLESVAGHSPAVVDSLQLAMKYFAAANNVESLLAAQLGLARFTDGRTSAASTHATDALTTATIANLPRWIARAAIAELRRQLDAGATSGLDDLLMLLSRHFVSLSRDEMAAGFTVQARAFERGGYVPLAKSLYDLAAELLETLRVEPLAQETFYDLEDHHAPYEHLIALAVKRSDAEDTFRQLYRSRRKDLQGAFDPAAFTSTRLDVQALLKQRRALQVQIQSHSASLARLRSAQTPDMKLIAATDAELNQAVTEWRSLGERIGTLEPAYRAYVGVPPPTLGEVQAALPARTALVAYTAPLDAELIILVVTADRVTFHRSPLPPERIWSLTRDALESVKAPQTQMDRTWDQLAALHNALIAPVEDRLADVDRIQILPTRRLHYLPFQALAKRTATGVRYLIEDKEVISVSGAALAALGRSASSLATESPRLLLLGNATEDLPDAEKEVQAIKGIFPNAQTFTRGAASQDVIRSQAPEAALLHFAVHGQLLGTLAASSHLKLSPKGDAGHFTVSDIRSLPLNKARLVTLSACVTSLGQGDPRGVAASSLSDAFIAAGAATVIGTLWYVADASTRDLMAEFYRQLSRGRCKGSALRSAQLSLLRSPRYAHPYYWSAFQLTGDAGSLTGGSSICAAEPAR